MGDIKLSHGYGTCHRCKTRPSTYLAGDYIWCVMCDGVFIGSPAEKLWLIYYRQGNDEMCDKVLGLFIDHKLP